MRPGRWGVTVTILVLLPLAATGWLLVVSAWLGLWTVANAAVAVRNHSIPALGRTVDGAARTAVVASWLTRGWGSAAPIAPALARVADAGDALATLGRAGLSAAPAIPAALGGQGPRSYLIATLNDAELFGSGGAPLNALVVRLDDGAPSIPVSGSVSQELNPDNEPYDWMPEGGLPWYRDGARYPFANANFHPDFRISGRNLVTAWNGLDLGEVDGVVTVDIAAVSAVLGEVGPIDSPTYGTVTADNVAQVLLVDAYRMFPETVEGALGSRQQGNAELQSALITRLRDPGMALRAARVLWEAIPSRHVQLFMVDPRIAEALAAVEADGSLTRPEGDVLGVHLQSGPSKLAIFQRVRIERDVALRADGSARVEQTVRFTNDVPEGLVGDPESHRGYLALTYRQRVAFRIPAIATDHAITVEDARALVDQGDTGPFPDGAGAAVLWQGQDIRPHQSRATTLAYDLPPGTFGGSDGLVYTLSADPQASLQPAAIDLSVTFPEGYTPLPTDSNWTAEGATARWTGILDRPLELVARA
jgi:hypothetical protein